VVNYSDLLQQQPPSTHLVVYKETTTNNNKMDDASLGLDLNLFSDSDISDDSDTDTSDEESEDERRRHKNRVLARIQGQTQKRRAKKRRGSNLHSPQSRREAEMLLQEGGISDRLLQSEYQKSPESSWKLVEFVRKDLERKPMKTTKRLGKDYLDPETQVMMTLRWLAGRQQYVDQCRRNGVSKASACKAIQQVIHAVHSNPNIGVPKRPTTVEECDFIVNGWAKLSGLSESRGLFKTVIGMLDGILISTSSP
jgi:hypothetical protein